MTEIEVYETPQAPAVPAPTLPVPPMNDIDSWTRIVVQVVRLAQEICDTPFVPDGLRGSAPAVSAAILAGREMGLGPMTSLANIDVIRGKPTQKPLLMRAMIQARGHKWEDVENTDTRAVVRGCRKGESAWATVTFTADQARKAGLELGKYPADKLYARATSRLAKHKFADVIMGMAYSSDEVEDGLDAGIAIESEDRAQPAAIEQPKNAAPAGRTARRRTPATAPAAAVPDGKPASGPAVAAGPAAPAPTAPDLPPLPGEEEITAPVSGDEARAPEGAKAGSSGPGAAGPGEHHDAVVIQRVTDLFDELASHADHEMKQIGRCVYCVPCNARLYNGRAPTAKEREELREYARQRARETAPAADGPAPGDDRHRKLVGIVQQHFGRLGFKDEDRAERLWAAAKLASTGDIESLNDLDPAELSTVADALAKCRDRKRLEEILATAGEGGGDG